MTHDQYQEQTSQLIDGELGATEQQSLFAHLSECDECRQFFHSVLALHSNLSTQSSIRVPAELDRQMAQAASDAFRATPAAFRLAIAASIAFLLLMGTIAFGPQMIKTSTTEQPGGFTSTAPALQPFSQSQ